MLIYPTIKELVDDLNPGSVVLVPMDLLIVMSKYLNPFLVDSGDECEHRLYSSLVYVLGLHTYEHDDQVDEKLRSWLFRFRGRATPKIDVHGKVDVELGSVDVLVALFSAGSSAKLQLPPQVLASAYINTIIGVLESLAEKHEEAFRGTSIFLYTPNVNPRFIEAVSRHAREVRVGPTYVTVPIRLESLYQEEAESIRALIKKGHEVALLLGVGSISDPVYICTGKRELKEYTLARYLAKKMIEEVLPRSDNQRSARAEFVAEGLLKRLYEKVTESSDNFWFLERRYPVNTVFLDALSSVIVGLKKEPWSGTKTLTELAFVFTLLKAMRRADILAKYAKLAGSRKESVEAIRNAKWVLLDSSEYYSYVREVERIKREEEEEVVSS